MRMQLSSKAVRNHEQRAWAVQVMEAAKDKVAVRASLAAALGRSERSIRRWEQRAREGTFEARPLGRKPQDVDRETRQGVIARKLPPESKQSAQAGTDDASHLPGCMHRHRPNRGQA